MMPLWLRGTILVALVFAAGVAVGFFVGRTTVHAQAANGMNPDSAVAAIDRRVSLDSTQRRVIRAALERHQAILDSAWRSMRPAIAAAVDSVQMEIYSALRPDQRPAFLEMMRSTHPGMPVRGMPRKE